MAHKQASTTVMDDSTKLNADRNALGSHLQPIWVPSVEAIEQSNIKAAMRQLSFNSYDCLYRWSVAQPAQFWSWVVDQLRIQFAERPVGMQIVDDSAWFAGARMNIAASCFQAPADSIAIICGNESGDVTRITVRELHAEACRVASGLRKLGLKSGDAVGLFMSMNARAVAIYLGTILAGCVVVSLADSLSREQILLRLKIGQAKAVCTTEFLLRGGNRIPLYSRVSGANIPVIVVDDNASDQTLLDDRDLTWESFVESEACEEVAYVDASSTINILFSSGTTGEPKAIPWDHVTPIRAASDGHFHQDIHPRDVVAWPTNFGWMMGPWLTFATLINQGTIAIFDGSPTGEPFGRFVQEAGVNILGVVPTLVCRWRQSGCMGKCDWSSIRLFSSTGECSNPSDMQYLSKLAGGKPIIEYCGGTEVGGGYLSSTVVQPNIPSTFSTPTLGSEYVILDDQGLEANVGEAYLVSPALGMSRKLLNANHFDVYYRDVPARRDNKRLRRHGDRLERLGNGYARVLGRSDDTFNISGIKVSSVELERSIGSLDEVSEVAVIAVPQSCGGPNRLVACVGIGDKAPPDTEALHKRMQSHINEGLCPLFKIDELFICSKLPRTASNKLNRRELRALYEQGRRLNVVSDAT